MLRRRSCTEMCVPRPARQLAADAAPAPAAIRASHHIWLPLVPHIGLGAGRSPGCCPSGRTGPTAHPSPACRNNALLRADAAAEALPGAVPWWCMPFSVSERLVMSGVGRTIRVGPQHAVGPSPAPCGKRLRPACGTPGSACEPHALSRDRNHAGACAAGTPAWHAFAIALAYARAQRHVHWC